MKHQTDVKVKGEIADYFSTVGYPIAVWIGGRRAEALVHTQGRIAMHHLGDLTQKINDILQDEGEISRGGKGTTKQYMTQIIDKIGYPRTNESSYLYKLHKNISGSSD